MSNSNSGHNNTSEPNSEVSVSVIPSVIQPIGVVHSCYPSKFAVPRQPGLVPQATAVIEIEAKWQPHFAVEGLEKFSHCWLVFVFHQNANLRYHAKVHPPRLGGESIGVFATRSPHRPNPIGLSLVKIEQVMDGKIYISGVDVVDGTPVLDIKPYLPEVEALPNAISGWPSQIQTIEIDVIWSDSLLEQIQNWGERIRQPALKQIIDQTLKLDPRPLIYREQQQKVHAFRLFDGDIHFEFTEQYKITIQKIVFC